MTLHLATSIADREGELHDKLTQILPALLTRFGSFSAQVTQETDQKVVSLLGQYLAVMDQLPSNVDHIGMHRRRSVELALSSSGGEGTILYIDIDHLLRWFELDVVELDRVLGFLPDYDCSVIGRGPLSMATLPARLRETERWVNHTFMLAKGFPWDLLMAARGLSVAAATLIVTQSQVQTAGNDVDWPLLCVKHGLSMNYVEAEGLTYQTNRVYAADIEDNEDQDLGTWALRVKLANQQIEAMQAYF